MINYNDQFEKDYQNLNPGQKSAVDTIYGPVMVIAGPGTGKTQILASRIGNILRSEEAQAGSENILCLTFTDGAAVNMRQRLLRLIGPEAYRISIYTFHSFCNNIIQDHKEKFGTSNLQPVSDLEKVEIIREIIDKLPVQHPLKRYTRDVYYDLKNLNDLFELMQKENLSAEAVSEGVKKEIEFIRNNEKYRQKRNKELLLKSAEEEIRKYERTLNACMLYPEFRKLLHDKERYTYYDMILWVIEALNSDEDLLAQYRERFQYILVDEYQDTNGAQNDLLWLLAGEDENPNIFVVGDDDQAIFRFQGASSQTMLDFQKRFSKFISLLLLTDNYRSTQSILDASGTLIEKNNDRLVNYIPSINKHLLAKKNLNSNDSPLIVEYLNEAQQTIAIAAKIKLLKQQQVKLNEVAIIYRSHQEADALIRYFDAEKIPYNIKRTFNILKDLFIVKIINILKYINLESSKPHSAEYLLFEILHYDFFGIAPLDIAKISIEVREAFKESNKIFWREKIKESNVENPSSKALKTLTDDLEFWIGNVYNLTLQQLVEKIIIRGGVLRYLMLHPEKHWYMEMLNSFFEFLKQECEKNPSLTLDGFLELIELMNTEEISLPLNKIISNAEGVIFTTAHGSKGEEYEHVFIINANQHVWLRSAGNRGFKMPQNLFSDKEEFDPVNDERRLFFVAMTRAKTHLEISYTVQSMDNKDREKCLFVAELEESSGIISHKESVTEDEVLEFKASMYRDEELPVVELFDRNYLDNLLKDYQLSVTHLNNYLKCPVRFYFVNVLRVPIAKNESMEFGSAMHDVLQRIYLNSSSSGEIMPPDNAWGYFMAFMNRHKESFTPSQFQRRVEYGKIILEKLYPQYLLNSHKNVSVEQRFNNIPVEGIPINGMLDKIEHYENDVVVIDYKTGKYGDDKFKKPYETTPGKESHESRYGGDYWRQAVFYAILIDNLKSSKMNFQSAEFIFVEPDPKTGLLPREKIFVSEEDKSIVKNQIKSVWQKIQNHEFEIGCNEDDCEWCNFLKRTRSYAEVRKIKTN